MTDRPRSIAADRNAARNRLRTAQAYLEFAVLAAEQPGPEMPAVAAGQAVLAGIAAADAICAIRLQLIHRGPDHRGAVALLEKATPDGKKLAVTVRRLLDLKDAAHYGIEAIAPRTAADAIRWARNLLDRAVEEVER